MKGEGRKREASLVAVGGLQNIEESWANLSSWSILHIHMKWYLPHDSDNQKSQLKLHTLMILKVACSIDFCKT